MVRGRKPLQVVLRKGNEWWWWEWKIWLWKKMKSNPKGTKKIHSKPSTPRERYEQKGKIRDMIGDVIRKEEKIGGNWMEEKKCK